MTMDPLLIVGENPSDSLMPFREENCHCNLVWPTFASANTFASKRLDKLEEEFPILQLSIDEVAWHLRESLMLTLDNTQECLSEETVKMRTRAGVLVEETWALISCQAAAFLNTGPGRGMAARGDGWLQWLRETADDC
eukprot:g30804.t1